MYSVRITQLTLKTCNFDTYLEFVLLHRQEILNVFFQTSCTEGQKNNFIVDAVSNMF